MAGVGDSQAEQNREHQARDLTRMLLLVLFIGGLTLCTLWVVRPFLPATIWASTIVVATWPLLLRVQKLLGGSRGLAVTVMTLLVLVLFVVPFWLAVSTILAHSDSLVGLAKSALAFRVPPVPHWVAGLPMIGPKAAELWSDVQDAGITKMLPRVAPYAGSAAQWFLISLGSFGRLLVQFLLTVIVVAIINLHGEAGARVAIRFGDRLGGVRGQQMVVLAARAIRAVALGVMVTSLVDAAIGGIGLWIAGVPLAPVLTAVMFIVCVAQAGPGVVLIPAVIWMYVFDSATMATVLLAFTLFAIFIDNFLRPMLIKKEANLPMLLVLVGVLGGLVAFGLIGLFIGPAVLAVSYTLGHAWIADDQPAVVVMDAPAIGAKSS
ncbi:AI-2E family transporter YdiK [Acidisoma cladoniae]|uniref:AI-2E family transporter YdiK n=1 Tax=Acidisoma cladoniae TaxID=3040935 RepID=UPI00254DDAFB|nr:AI-2E family transporter YdiK [Acidisoma sp. PAMC 29798]